MAWIGLKDMEIRKAPIGYYAEEKRMGNDFQVSVMADLDIPNVMADHLENTLNYETIYEVVQTVMYQEMDLIEAAAYRIYDNLREKAPSFRQIEVCIRKFKPLQVKSGGDSVIVMRFPE